MLLVHVYKIKRIILLIDFSSPIGTSSTASALSQYIDSLCDNKISVTLNLKLKLYIFIIKV